MIRIGALISGGGTNLRAIIEACEAGRVKGRVVFAGADNPAAGGLAIAEARCIPTFVVDYAALLRESPGAPALPRDADIEAIASRRRGAASTGNDTGRFRRSLAARVAAESKLLDAMRPFEIDLLVLAGFMRVLTPYFIDRVSPDPEKPRIMNIHPSLLPAFPGTDGYGDTFRYGCKVGGCTVHFVDEGEDTGPIIGQRAFEILPGDTLESVRGKGLRLEWELYPACIQRFAEGRLRVRGLEDAEGMGAGRRVVDLLPQK